MATSAVEKIRSRHRVDVCDCHCKAGDPLVSLEEGPHDCDARVLLAELDRLRDKN